MKVFHFARDKFQASSFGVQLCGRSWKRRHVTMDIDHEIGKSLKSVWKKRQRKVLEPVGTPLNNTSKSVHLDRHRI